MNSSSSYAPDLPDAVIHQITSSFNLKQAAQTSILSKSWNSGWLTRPILDLDEPYFPKHYRRHFNLMLFGNKTLPRYEESNQPIHTFRLRLESDWYCCNGLAAEWTSKAMKMGPTDVSIRLKHDTIRMIKHDSSIHIPIYEVFGNENILSLCLERVRIDRLEVIRIKCSGLKSLELTEVQVSIDSFCNILSCCPLIETLSLNSLKFSDNDEQRGACTISLGKLTSLVLCELQLDQLVTLFLSDFSTKFPALKDLTITINDYVFGKDDRIHVISSRSLETLNFRLSCVGWYFDEDDKLRRVELDLPSIRKFTFEGSRMPELWFSQTTSGDQNWDSHVSISHEDELSTTWFRQLSKLLSNQRDSKIHLVLHMHGSEFSCNYQAEEIKGVEACQVDDLTIYTEEGVESEFFNSLLDGMFRICRPKMITHYVDPSYDKFYQSWDDKDLKIRNNSLLLRRALELGLAVETNLTEEISLMYGLRGLEEVHAQELQDDSISEERIVRFQLKWKP